MHFMLIDMATWHTGWDCELACDVVGDEGVGRPQPRVRTTVPSIKLDGEEVECGLVDGGEVTGYSSHLVQYIAVMPIWPCVPLQTDRGAGGQGEIAVTRCGILVTDDVWVLVGAWGDKTVILIVGIPAWLLGWILTRIHPVRAANEHGLAADDSVL